MLRRAAVLALLAACASPAAAAEREVVAYLLGRVVSGPYRVSADLGAGTVEEARSPGAHGDGAGLDALTMPATRSRPLPAGSAERIRALAGAVLRDGCRATPGNQPQATSGTHPLGIAFHPDWVNTTKV